MTRNSLAFLTLAWLGSACTAQAPDPDLVLEISELDHVSGTFTRDTTTLHFEFEQRADGTLFGEYREADGTHLVSSTLAGNHELMVVRDGALVIDTIVGSPAPDLQGDPSALEQLSASPALALAEQLRLALQEYGVSDALVNPPKPASAISDAYWGSDGYYHMGPGETGQFGTQPFWWPTQVVLKSFSSRCTTVKFQVGLGIDTHVVPARGYKFVTGYWWASWLYITPLNAYVDWSYLGLGVCAPGEVGAFTRYGG